MEDWLEDCAASEHWNRYWNAVSAPSDDEWPEGLIEDERQARSSTTSFWCRIIGSRRSLTIGTTPNLCIRAAKRCNEDLEWRFQVPCGILRNPGQSLLQRLCRV